MFRIIYPNRWLIWTLAIAVMIAIALLGAIERFAIEQDSETVTNQIQIPKNSEGSIIDTSDWKTWRWDNACGELEIRHPSNWTTRLNRFGLSSFSSCVGEIVKLPTGYLSLSEASEGVVLILNYSRGSAEAETTAFNIEKEYAQYPHRALHFSGLLCVQNKDVENNYSLTTCYTRRTSGIYVLTVNVRDTADGYYDKHTALILSSARLPN